jgi:hypothetical protein
VAGSHVEAVLLFAAEDEVRAALRQLDEADGLVSLLKIFTFSGSSGLAPAPLGLFSDQLGRFLFPHDRKIHRIFSRYFPGRWLSAGRVTAVALRSQPVSQVPPKINRSVIVDFGLT